MQSLGARFAHDLISLDYAADDGLPRVRIVRRRLPVPRHGRDVAGRGRSARPGAAAQRARAVGRAVVARAGTPLGARAAAPARARTCRSSEILTHARDRERDAGARCVRRLDEPAAAHPGDRARGRTHAADRGRLDSRQSRDAASGRCAAQRTARPPDRAGVHGRRRTRGDAAPAADWDCCTTTC